MLFIFPGTKQFVELSLTDAREVIHCSNSKESIGDIDLTDSKESIGDIDYTDKLNRTLGVRSTPTAWENIEVIEQGKPKSGEPDTTLEINFNIVKFVVSTFAKLVVCFSLDFTLSISERNLKK